MMSVSEELAKTHYADLSSKPFFPSLVEYICSGPVCAMVWQGKEAVKTGRKLVRHTYAAYWQRHSYVICAARTKSRYPPEICEAVSGRGYKPSPIRAGHHQRRLLH
eukprot:scaffold4638_cov242-Prasinococcus_capsulatus_cf.AAC.1